METSNSPLVASSPVAAERKTFIRLGKKIIVDRVCENARTNGFKVEQIAFKRGTPIVRITCYQGTELVFRAVNLGNDNWAVTYSKAYYGEGAL